MDLRRACFALYRQRCVLTSHLQRIHSSLVCIQLINGRILRFMLVDLLSQHFINFRQNPHDQTQRRARCDWQPEGQEHHAPADVNHTGDLGNEQHCALPPSR